MRGGLGRPYTPSGRTITSCPPSSSRIVRGMVWPPPLADVGVTADAAPKGATPAGLGRGSGEPPLLYDSALADVPSPQSHSNERSSVPTSDALAARVISWPTNSGRRSSTVHVQVAGCCTLKLCFRRASEPSSNRRRSHAGLSPFGCPLIGSSSGV